MTLAQVAKRAGVSSATVSRVLNSATVVKTSTRARVIRAARELNYHPNLHAQSLARGHSRTLGVIVSNMENPFFLDIYRTLESLARARGYEAVMANTGYDPEQLISRIRLMIGWRVAGLAAIVSEMDHHVIQIITDSRIPCVFYDVRTPGRNITNVRVDYRKGVSKMVEYLHDLGHTQIGFIGHHGSLAPINERRNTFLEAVARWGAESLTMEGADGPQGGRQAVREMLQSGFRPTAIICVNDFMALGVLHELHSEGIRVPRDVSVTGFDNIGLAEFCSPPLTTVHIPRDQIGQMSFELLASGEKKLRTEGRGVLITPELVIRESTGPAARH
jgi:DNA-binding LacI/PurR family transcriptional regulator